MLVARLQRVLLAALGPVLASITRGGRSVLRSKHWGPNWKRMYALAAAYGAPALLLVVAPLFKLAWD